MPISWVRVDPQVELLASIQVLQPTTFWTAQLEYSRSPPLLDDQLAIVTFRLS